jgi:hypothetical protein
MANEPERRLRTARERVERLSSSIAANRGFGPWDELWTANLEVLVAEREVAEAAGDEFAVEIDVELTWSIGAPLPHLLANGSAAYLLFLLEDTDPHWDGTEVRVVDPAAAETEQLGLVAFHRVHSIKFGGPNDEAITGHPLSGRGLTPYRAHQVVNSRWIADEERINSVHPYHRGGWHERLRHYVFCFHDETFECIAEGFSTERGTGSIRDVLASTVSRLWA